MQRGIGMEWTRKQGKEDKTRNKEQGEEKQGNKRIEMLECPATREKEIWCVKEGLKENFKYAESKERKIFSFNNR